MVVNIGPPRGDTPLFDTPEEAALAGWRSTPSAHPRVISVDPSTQINGLRVTLEVDGLHGSAYREVTNCVEAPDGRWFTAGIFGI